MESFFVVRSVWWSLAGFFTVERAQYLHDALPEQSTWYVELKEEMQNAYWEDLSITNTLCNSEPAKNSVSNCTGKQK